MENFDAYSRLPEWQALVETMNAFALRLDNDPRLEGIDPKSWPADMAALAETLHRMDTCVRCGDTDEARTDDASRMYAPIAKDETPGRYIYRCVRGHVWGCSWGI